MSQPEPLPSTNVLPFPHAWAEKEEAGRQEEPKPKRYYSAAIELPPGLTPQRQGIVKGYLIVPLHSDEGSTTTLHVERPRALAPPSAGEHARAVEALNSSVDVSSSGLHALAMAVILVGLLPILILINRTASWPATSSARDSAGTEPQATIFMPAITMPTTLTATAGQHIRFPIAIDGTEAVRGGGTIVISRLPPGSTFSAGVPQGQTKWQLKSREARDLRLLLPEDARDEATLMIQFLADDGHVISDAATILEVIGNLEESIPVRRVKTEVIHGQTWEQPDEEQNSDNADASAVNSASDPVPLPSRRPSIAK